ncbi:MAG TPA: hypothetical protein DCW50_12825 [Gammaproteobacteria bacterium]|nr:hypothetical protein [Gammaproteobacteria bacterium]HBP84438.1 hypothetical protein [Gammaproteobacteria bacterium]
MFFAFGVITVKLIKKSLNSVLQRQVIIKKLNTKIALWMQKMMKKIPIRVGMLMAIALPLSGCSDGWCWPFDCTASKSSSGVVDDSANTTTTTTDTTTTTADTSTSTTTSSTTTSSTTSSSGATEVSNTASITTSGQQEFALSKVNWLHTNVSSWPVTHNLTVNLGAGTICMEWGGTSTWPTATIRHTDGTRDIKVNANPWVFVWRNGAWYGGTWEWMTPNGNCKPMRVVEGGHIKRPPLTNWTPASGETLYFMVSSLARAGNLNNYQARTNVVSVVWP